jgi:nucleotide-binding universal stress UspA family protein
LRKIAQSKPDVVMKQAREHSYVLGLTSNTDWDLARRSPVNVWLVSEENEEINRLVAAIGNRLADDVDVTTGMDYEIVRTARSISDVFKANIYPVNAYQVPNAQGLTAGAGAVAAAVVPVQEEVNANRTEMVKRHDSAVKALTQLFLIQPEDVYVCEGDPNKVIPEVAEQLDADMIVLGASSIGRLERLVSRVTVEPVMAKSECDIFVVRDPDRISIPDADVAPLNGIPRYDLERAIANPGDTFESPQEVALTQEISAELRDRILQAWEYDIRAQMEEENEGGPLNDIDVGTLDEIRKARKILAKDNASNSEKAPRLSAAM